MKINHTKTLLSCFVGSFNQAIMANMTALLFVPFMELYGLTLTQLGLLVGINFATQIFADSLLTIIIDRVSYKKGVQAANVLSFVGMSLFCLAPVISIANIYSVFVIATVIFALASGMMEVLISPITDTIPEDYKNKKAAMSLTHSFYAWGQFVCIIFTAVSLLVLGAEKWNYIVACFLIVPVADFVLFSSTLIVQSRCAATATRAKKSLFHPIFIFCLLAIMFGAGTEIIMNQFISAFAELQLGLKKIYADILGMGMYALAMGVGRALHGKYGDRLNIHKLLIIGSAACVVTYPLTAVIASPYIALGFGIITGFFASLLWPGTLSVAGEAFPRAGAWIFSVLAISGDIGATIFSSASGAIGDNYGMDKMLIFAMALPLLTFICHVVISVIKKKTAA